MEFDLEPGEEVNEGEWQASQTPLTQPEGEHQEGQEPQVLSQEISKAQQSLKKLNATANEPQPTNRRIQSLGSMV